jgi:hypothetical protein
MSQHTIDFARVNDASYTRNLLGGVSDEARARVLLLLRAAASVGAEPHVRFVNSAGYVEVFTGRRSSVVTPEGELLRRAFLRCGETLVAA